MISIWLAMPLGLNVIDLRCAASSVWHSERITGYLSSSDSTLTRFSFSIDKEVRLIESSIYIYYPQYTFSADMLHMNEYCWVLDNIFPVPRSPTERFRFRTLTSFLLVWDTEKGIVLTLLGVFLTINTMSTPRCQWRVVRNIRQPENNAKILLPVRSDIMAWILPHNFLLQLCLPSHMLPRPRYRTTVVLFSSNSAGLTRKWILITWPPIRLAAFVFFSRSYGAVGNPPWHAVDSWLVSSFVSNHRQPWHSGMTLAEPWRSIFVVAPWRAKLILHGHLWIVFNDIVIFRWHS